MSPIPLSWVITASALTTIVGFAGGVTVGRAMCQNGYFKAAQKAEAKHAAVVTSAQALDQQAADREVGRQTIVREIVREVPKLVDRPVYRNVCVDADGVQLLQRAVDAANGGQTLSGAAGAAADLRTTTGSR